MANWQPPKPKSGPTLTGRPGRKPYARERGIVPSSVPPKDRIRACGGCGVETTVGKLRQGYCSRCWAS